MGAGQPEGTVTELSLDHPYLRNARTRATPEATTLLASVPTQKAVYKQWKEQLEQQEGVLSSKQWLLWPQEHSFQEGGVCSTAGQLTLTYQYYPRLLSAEMALRKKEQRRFLESQMWYLLLILAEGKVCCGELGQPVGDIHPRSIFLNSQGEAKLACLSSWPGQVTAYRKVVLEEDWGYLAPQDMERWKLGAMDNNINTEAQIFAIGLVLLATSTHKDHQDIYDLTEKEINRHVFDARMRRFQHDFYYSEIFRATVTNLLSIDPYNRLTAQELKVFLYKHSDNIKARKSLHIDNVPLKLQVTINELLRQIAVAKTQQFSMPPPPSPFSPLQGGRPSQESLANALGIEANQANLAAMIQTQARLSQENTPQKVARPQSQPMQLYRQTGAPEPNRPNINRAFSSHSITSPRGKSPMPSIRFVNKPTEPKKEEKVIESEVQRVESAEGWKKKEQSIMGQLNQLISETKSPEEVFEGQQQARTTLQAEANKQKDKIVDQLQKEGDKVKQKQESVQEQIENKVEQKIQNLKEALPQVVAPEHQKIGKSNDQQKPEAPIPKQIPSEVAPPQNNQTQTNGGESNQQKAEKVVEAAKQQMGQAVEKSKEVFEESKQLMKQRFNQLTSNTQEYTEKLKEKANETADGIKNKAQQLKQQTQNVSIPKPSNEAQSSNYILIDEGSSKVTDSVASGSNKIKAIIEEELEASQQTEEQLLDEEEKEQGEEQEEEEQFHTLEGVSTVKSYDQCWDQAMLMLNQPATCFKEIKADKVSTIKRGEEWILKVGPASMRVDTNKEEGKVMLSSLPESKCQGNVLGGVLKDEDKRHRIWINSGLRRNGEPFLDAQFWRKGLQAAVDRMERRQQ